jgi:hypothetical protein
LKNDFVVGFIAQEYNFLYAMRRCTSISDKSGTGFCEACRLLNFTSGHKNKISVAHEINLSIMRQNAAKKKAHTHVGKYAPFSISIDYEFRTE